MKYSAVEIFPHCCWFLSSHSNYFEPKLLYPPQTLNIYLQGVLTLFNYIENRNVIRRRRRSKDNFCRVYWIFYEVYGNIFNIRACIFDKNLSKKECVSFWKCIWFNMTNFWQKKWKSPWGILHIFALPSFVDLKINTAQF